jgi:putative SOS response-associated peptidase YedK
MVFAVLWESWKAPEGEIIESCTILTTSSNKLIEPLHDRMPLILHPQEYDIWLNREISEPEKLKSLYKPYPAERIEMYPVSSLMNSPKNDCPELIKPSGRRCQKHGHGNFLITKMDRVYAPQKTGLPI